MIGPTDSYRGALAQAAGAVRECLAPMAGIPHSVPLWFTEIGVPSTGVGSQAAQAAGLSRLTRAVCDYAGTFNITDVRWFNLRDSSSSRSQTPSALSFSTFGLLRSDYATKASFAAYRKAMAACGTRSRPARRTGRPPGRRVLRGHSLSLTG